MFKLNSVEQLEAWVFNQAPIHATKGQIQKFADDIRRDPKRPDFLGQDWTEYLHSLLQGPIQEAFKESK